MILASQEVNGPIQSEWPKPWPPKKTFWWFSYIIDFRWSWLPRKLTDQFGASGPNPCPLRIHFDDFLTFSSILDDVFPQEVNGPIRSEWPKPRPPNKTFWSFSYIFIDFEWFWLPRKLTDPLDQTLAPKKTRLGLCSGCFFIVFWWFFRVRGLSG